MIIYLLLDVTTWRQTEDDEEKEDLKIEFLKWAAISTGETFQSPIRNHRVINWMKYDEASDRQWE